MHVIVRFTDTGGGISAENLSRVFSNPIHNQDQRHRPSAFYCRRIVREHGGELSIESSEVKDSP